MSLGFEVPLCEQTKGFLRDRGGMLRRARDFFFQKNLLEVDCPALSRAAPIDLHIDVMQVRLKGEKKGYLHTSPEYGMKRLLSAGLGDIYQISHVFREEEVGPLHNPEFTMAEWYRVGFTFEQMIQETVEFIHLFLKKLPTKTLSYRETLQQFLGIDYLNMDCPSLLDVAKSHQLDLPQDAIHWDKDTILQLLVTFLIEPQLGNDHLFILTHFPASQAALSKTALTPNLEAIAYRFEIYHMGIELANGYHELTDPQEQRQRFIATNQARSKAGKEELPIDEQFLSSLEAGIPDCCGVAVGFDRLLMLKHKEKTLRRVIPFPWED